MVFFTGIILMVCCWAVFLLPYFLWLRRTTQFKLQRIYLFTSIIIGIIVALLWANIDHPLTTKVLAPILINTESKNVISIPSAFSSNWLLAIQAIYFTVASILIARLLYQVFYLFFMARSYAIIYSEKRRIVETIDLHTPYSFFNLIFFSKIADVNARDKEIILRHEFIHTSQLHSFDILLCEFLLVFTWFIPIIKLYKILFNELHEYIADEKVTLQIPLREYGDLLIRQSLGEGRYLTHNFAFGSLKQRILKLRQQRSGSIHLIALLMPFLCGIFFINGFDKVQIVPFRPQTVSEIKNAQQIYLTPYTGFTIIKDGNTIHTQPAPDYPGGNDQLTAFFKKHIDLKKLGSSAAGQYALQLYFDMNGEIIHMTILQPVSPEIENALKNIVDEMPAWNAPIINGRKVASNIILPVIIK